MRFIAESGVFFIVQINYSYTVFRMMSLFKSGMQSKERGEKLTLHPAVQLCIPPHYKKAHQNFSFKLQICIPLLKKADQN